MKRSGFTKKPTKPLKRTALKRSSTKTPIKRKSAGKTKNGRIKSISKLKKDLWKVFSLYIRQRDNFTCFTCGRKGEGKGMHCGHFIPKSVGGILLYFNETNVNCQCYNCNINLGGNQYIYGKKLGKKVADELYRIKDQEKGKWTEENYLREIKKYKELI